MRTPLRRGLAVRAAAGVIAAAFVTAVGASAAVADSGTACPSSTETPYTMELHALTGPAGADLGIAVATDTTRLRRPRDAEEGAAEDLRR